jgi:transposase-like protein
MSLAASIAGLFKWRQFEPEVILLAVGWYLRFSLSYRDVEELLAERGISVDHVTLGRWVQRYAPELEKRLRKRLKATHAASPPAVAELKTDGILDENCRHRVGRYLNNLVEQDHRAIKRRVKASQHFRSFWGAWRTLAGYEAVHMIRKGQASGSPSDGGVTPLHAIIASMFGFEG